MISFNTGTLAYLSQNDWSFTSSLILLFFLDLGHFLFYQPYFADGSSETNPRGLETTS